MDINTAITEVLRNHFLWVIFGAIAAELATGLASAWKHRTFQLRLVGKIIPTAVWGALVGVLIPVIMQWANNAAEITVDTTLYMVFLIVVFRSTCENLKELGFPYADHLLGFLERLLNRFPQTKPMLLVHPPGMPSNEPPLAVANVEVSHVETLNVTGSATIKPNA